MRLIHLLYRNNNHEYYKWITDEPFEVFDLITVSLEEFKPAQYRLEDATPLQLWKNKWC